MKKIILTIIAVLIVSNVVYAAPKSGKAWVTAYYPPEKSAYITAVGTHCSIRGCASNLLPLGTIVYISGVGKRYVNDTGAKSNDATAKRKGANIWIDLWFPHSGMWSTKVVKYRVVGKISMKQLRKIH